MWGRQGVYDFSPCIRQVQRRYQAACWTYHQQRHPVELQRFEKTLLKVPNPHKYGRKDIGLAESTPSVIQDFELYLGTVAGCAYNTSVKKMKTLKTITIYTQKCGYLLHDPFLNHRFHLELVNRGFLTDEEIMKIANKDFGINRLELVKDIFFCFTGLAYIDVSNLMPDNIVTLDDKQWIMIRRQKTSVETKVLLLDIPKRIIAKYGHKTYRDGKFLPVLTN